ncbi:MAG: tetratricopeptide repeat protein, partial [Planctomycetota bacterium]
LYAQAKMLREEGDYRGAIGRLRAVVRLDPTAVGAFVDMGDLLYRIGDLDDALSAYQLALDQVPTLRSALRGAARIYRRRNDHASAARLLRTILRHDPNDAEVWLNLGDVAVFQGDEALARECYTRAAQLDPQATRIVKEAKRRLQLMNEVSRRYNVREP